MPKMQTDNFDLTNKYLSWDDLDNQLGLSLIIQWFKNVQNICEVNEILQHIC